MPTPAEITYMRSAFQKAKLTGGQYRAILAMVGEVSSERELTAEGYEDCMAAIEECGFRDGSNAAYWHGKVARRQYHARLEAKATELLAAQPHPLETLCRRASQGMQSDPGELCPQEWWKLMVILQIECEAASAGGTKNG